MNLGKLSKQEQELVILAIARLELDDEEFTEALESLDIKIRLFIEQNKDLNLDLPYQYIE